MVAKSYTLHFNGYWRSADRAGLPRASGLFCVYRASHNAILGGVTIKELIYVGEAGDIRTRVANHELWPRWTRTLRFGEELCFAAALVPASERLRAEAALIYQYRPRCNEDTGERFPFDTTTVKTVGEHSALDDAFTVSQASFRERNLALYAGGRR
jgi:hypothetical protein